MFLDEWHSHWFLKGKKTFSSYFVFSHNYKIWKAECRKWQIHAKLLILKMNAVDNYKHKSICLLSLHFFVSCSMNILCHSDSSLIFLSQYHLTWINFLLVLATPDTDRESLSNWLWRYCILNLRFTPLTLFMRVRREDQFRQINITKMETTICQTVSQSCEVI